MTGPPTSQIPQANGAPAPISPEQVQINSALLPDVIAVSAIYILLCTYLRLCLCVCVSQKQKLRADLDLVKGNLTVMTDMLNQLRPGESSSSDTELLQVFSILYITNLLSHIRLIHWLTSPEHSLLNSLS